MAIAIASTADPAGVTAVSSVTTYAAASTGAAASNRIVAITVTAKVAQTPTRVTIDPGGGPVLEMGLRASAIFSTMGAWIYDTLVPNGTTASVAITWTGAVTSLQNHITIFKITGADTALSSAVGSTSSDMDATSPLRASGIVLPTGAAILASAGGAASASAKTWAGISVSSDAGTGAGGFRYTNAFSTSPSTTITCTGGTNGEDGALALVVYQVDGGLKQPLSLRLQPFLTQ